MRDRTEEITFHGEQLLRNSRMDSLRGKMRAFISEVDEVDLKTRRATVSNGERLSDLVKADRDERL